MDGHESESANIGAFTRGVVNAVAPLRRNSSFRRLIKAWASGEKQTSHSLGSSPSNGKATDGRDRRSGSGSGSDTLGDPDRRMMGFHSDTQACDDDLDSPASARRSKIVSRSESLRERAQRKNHREKRKHSDPNLPPSHASDVDIDGRTSISCNNSGSSSNSSLSVRSLENSNPADMVSGSRTPGFGLPEGSSGIPITLSTASSSGSMSGITPWDSDLEADSDPPEWTRNLDPAILERMPAKEKQRQEVINELFHTERSYVRNLKVLERVFYRPLLENGLLPADLMSLLFPNLPEILKIHSQFNDLMKARKKEQPVVKDIIDILSVMFENASGDDLKSAAAVFCRNQSVALESLRDRRKKDSKLQSFLTEAEGNPVCKRLQLKDIIPCTMQRLTKYPLLLESLLKYTSPRTPEAAAVKAALERSKEILNHVNQAVKEAENHQRLVEIQKRLDKSAFEKNDLPSTQELKVLDVTKHRLLYEGPLTWRIKGQKSVDLHVVLLEEMILLLQKQDDRYVLKFHTISYLSGKEEPKFTHSPLIHISTVLVRPVATDKLAFFLVNTHGPQIYDLVAASVAERKAWFRHITDATESYKTRDGRNKRPEYPAGAAGSSSSPPLSASPSFEASADPSEKQKGTDPLLACSEPETEASSSAEVESGAASGNSTAPTSTTPPSEEQPSPSAEATDAEAGKTNGIPTAESNGTPVSSPTLTRSDTSASTAPRRRLQRVEILKIADGTPLIDPTEVRISQDAVLTAEPVLTPLEKLRRKDQLIRTALAEKQRLVADILHVSHSELDFMAESVDDKEGEKEARLLILAAIHQASHLTTLLNETLRLTEEEAIAAVSETNPFFISGSASSPRAARRINRMPGTPAPKLLPISSKLNRNLTELLGLITQRDEERDHLRRELQKAREQVSLLLQMKNGPVDSSPASSRPSSCASVSSEAEVVVELPEQATGEIALKENDPLSTEAQDGRGQLSAETEENPSLDASLKQTIKDEVEKQLDCEALNQSVTLPDSQLPSSEDPVLNVVHAETSEA